MKGFADELVVLEAIQELNALNLRSENLSVLLQCIMTET